jgi:ABC-type glycerol-3-phosphate transport system permease component
MINETRRSRAALYAVLAAAFLFALAPYYWTARTAVITNFAAISASSPLLPSPDIFSVDGFIQAFTRYDMRLFLRNSVLISVGSTLLSLVIAIPGAYSFARLDFPGRKLLFYTAVFTIMFPWIVLTIPVYDVYLRLNLLNTFAGVIIALSIFIMPLCLWLLQGFFRQGLPENIEEAALMDGTSRLGAFVRIVLPLSLPAVGATAMFTFLNAWNNFLWVFLLTSDEQYRTATVQLHYVLGSEVLRDWNTIMAVVMLIIVPPIVFYGLSQRYVGEGLGGSV